jgi:hypothetical protein
VPVMRLAEPTTLLQGITDDNPDVSFKKEPSPRFGELTEREDGTTYSSPCRRGWAGREDKGAGEIAVMYSIEAVLESLPICRPSRRYLRPRDRGHAWKPHCAHCSVIVRRSSCALRRSVSNAARPRLASAAPQDNRLCRSARHNVQTAAGRANRHAIHTDSRVDSCRSR